MGSISSSIIRVLSESFFGSGKDGFTQTQIPTKTNAVWTLKGEDLIDVNDRHKFHIYNTTPQLKAVIDRKAMMKANGRWEHYRIDKSGAKVHVENSEFVRLLENPNFVQNGNEFTAQRSQQLDIYGNGIIFVNKGATGIPRILWNLPAANVGIERTGKIYRQTRIEDVILKYFLTDTVNGETRDIFDPSEIIHLRDSDPNDVLKGLSKIESLMLTISNVRAAQGFRNRIITSNAMLGILSTKTAQGMGVISLDNKAQKQINQGFGKKWGMQQGKGDILQTEASVEWQAMSYPTKDLMLFEEVDDNFKMIIDAYGLNANMFSFSKQSTFENMEHGIRLAYRDTIIPECERDAMAFTKAFGMDGRTEWLEICFDHLDLLKTDESQINLRNAQTIQTLVSAGVTSESIEELTDLDAGTIIPPMQSKTNV